VPVIHGLHISQQFVGQCAMKALHHRV
jgi:hypothetical protein